MAAGAGAGPRPAGRELGNLLREHKEDLGALVSIEAGKIVSEGLGEVQEMIDIATWASDCPGSCSATRSRPSAPATG